MYRSVLLAASLSVVFAIVPSVLFAQKVSISVSDNSAELKYSKRIAQDDFGATESNIRFIFNDDKNAKIISTGLHFIGEPGNLPGLELEVGGDIYGAFVNRPNSDEDLEALALGIGGGVSFTPVQLGGLTLFGNLYYAPKVLTFLDAERLREMNLGISYPITPKVRVHLSYQHITTDTDGGNNADLVEQGRIGFAAHF